MVALSIRIYAAPLTRRILSSEKKKRKKGDTSSPQRARTKQDSWVQSTTIAAYVPSHPSPPLGIGGGGGGGDGGKENEEGAKRSQRTSKARYPFLLFPKTGRKRPGLCAKKVSNEIVLR